METNPLNENSNKEKIMRGFAIMTKEKRQAIAGKGGKVAHEKGLAHRWSSAEASAAGKKGADARTRSLKSKASDTE